MITLDNDEKALFSHYVIRKWKKINLKDKDTQNFERESFKDKILRELEANKQDIYDDDGDFEVVNEKLQYTANDSDIADITIDESDLITTKSQPVSASDIPSEDAGENKVLTSQKPQLENISTMSRKPRQSQENLKRSAKKASKRLAGKIIAVVVLILFVVGAATAYFGYRYLKSELQPYSTTDKTVKSISIPKGASSKDIGGILQKNKIIKNATAFKYYTKLKSLYGFKSGYYNLAPNMTLTEIAKALQQGGTDKPVAPVLGKITIPEGFTIDQMATKVSDNVESKSETAKTPFTKAEFLKVVTDQNFINKMRTTYPELFASLPDASSGVKYQLEGYLFPATYEYSKNSTMQSIVEEMVAAMNQNMTPYFAKIKANNMTVNETLSIAALTEKEANNDADRRNVAQVFYNRINSGMTLGSNISILYAEGKLGEKTSLADDAAVNTQLASPYNLYMNLGYGPGPVTNPSLSAIKAAIEPTANNYLYFVADVTTGKVYFSETQDEHDANVKKYVNDKLPSSSNKP